MRAGRPTDMRRLAILPLLATVLLAACASGGASSGGHAISGRVLAGPTCPVERVESPCPPTPWTGTVRATAADGATYDARTGANGDFSIGGLAPGTYKVAALTSGPARALPLTVTVGDADRTVTLRVDTGIR